MMHPDPNPAPNLNPGSHPVAPNPAHTPQDVPLPSASPLHSACSVSPSHVPDTSTAPASPVSPTAPIPRVSFGIIVLNGEPFTRHCLRALYPYAHEILVVEGGSRHAAHACTPDGHSTDGTLQTLRRFVAEEDPDGKVQLITREGFWSEKDEQSNAYATRATGDWLWQVDIDEFYRPEDMEAILARLAAEPDITGAAFHTRNAWGDLHTRVNGLHLLAMGQVFRRLFRWGRGYRYATHRPPTVLDPHGRDLTQGRWISGADMEARGIVLYHYSLLFPRHVEAKCGYYESLSEGARRERAWFEDGYMRLNRPFHVFNVSSQISWLEPWEGAHPPAVLDMMQDIEAGRIAEPLRPMTDVHALVARPSYRMMIRLLRMTLPLYRLGLLAWHRRPRWMSKRTLRRLRGGGA